ncbi:MAG TPA: hypothetical protein VHZ76_07920 [Gammaproteobacteria bacterium]|nr:hypothetical protein [Gammaproteobacteria bacterium]
MNNYINKKVFASPLVGEADAARRRVRGFSEQAIQTTRKRYTLTELLAGTTPKSIKELKKKTKWFRDTTSVGREI